MFEDLDDEFIRKWTLNYSMFEKNIGKFYCHFCDKNIVNRRSHSKSELHVYHCLNYVKNPENYYIPQR